MVSNNAIRQAHPSDYDHVISVANEWWDRDVSVGLPRLFLEHFWTTSLIAEDADGLAGFLIGFHSPGEPETAYVHYVATNPATRRSGTARRLYGAFSNQARDAGRTVVRAITSASNHGSIAFHRTMGFNVSEPIPNFNGPDRPAVQFELLLS